MSNNFNPNAPSILGTEDFPILQRAIDLGANPLQGVAQRINPGAIKPLSIGLFHDFGLSNSLHGAEIVDTLTPTLFQETIFPATNTGALKTGWTTETGAASDFGRVNKSADDSTWLGIASAVGSGTGASPYGIGWKSGRGVTGTLAFRGGRANTYRTDATPSRVVSVTMNIRVAFAATTTNTGLRLQFGVQGFGDTTQLGNNLSGAIHPKSDGVFRTYSFVVPQDPWSMTALNFANPYWNAPNLAKTWDTMVTTAGPYAFGFNLIDTKGSGWATNDVMVSGMWLTVTYCAENSRFRAYYDGGYDVAGWQNVPAIGPDQRRVIFTSNAATTALTTPAGGTNGAGDFTAADAGKVIIRQSDGQVVGTVQSVTNSTTAVLTANGASTNTNVVGYLGTNPASLSASTFYYLVQGSVATGVAKSSTPLRVLQDPSKSVLSAPGTTGENRSLYNLVFSSSGSMVAATATQTVGEFVPYMIGLTTYNGGILVDADANPESFPYVLIDYNGSKFLAGALDPLYEIRNGQSLGQNVTTAAVTTYQAIKVAVCRFSATTDPDQPLTIEVRDGAGLAGTLRATATIPVSALSKTTGTRKPTVIEVNFASAFTNVLNTQYTVVFKSSATAGRGWSLPALEYDADPPYTLRQMAQNAIVGKGIGGNTDGSVRSTGNSNNPDFMVALCAAPTAPASFAATAQAAA